MKREPGQVRIKQEFVPVKKEPPQVFVPVPVKKEKKVSAATRPVFRSDFNADPPVLRVTLSSGVSEVSSLQPGPNGFCIADFKCLGGVTESEIPNLVLATKLAIRELEEEKKGGRRNKKEKEDEVKPEDKDEKKERVEEAKTKDVKPEGEKVDDTPRGYSLMYYKRDQTVGVRQKYGKKRQVLSFRDKGEKGREFLMSIGERVVEKLLSGTSYAEAKIWAVARCQ